MAANFQNVRVGTSLELLAGTDTNDSDQTFTVPPGTSTVDAERWHVYSISVEYTSDGAGTRQLFVDFTDDGDVVFCRLIAGVTQATGLTYRYSFAPGLPQQTAVLTPAADDPSIMQAMPSTMILRPGWKIRVWDVAAIAPAADDLVIRILVDRAKAGETPT